MKTSFFCIGLLILVLFVTAGCVPITVQGPLPSLAPDSRGANEPTATPTSPVSPLPSPTSPVSPLPTPTSPVSPLVAPTMEANAQANAGAAASTEYVVRRGDTMAKIALTYGVTVRAILDANPTVRSADMIYVGQRLKVPSK